MNDTRNLAWMLAGLAGAGCMHAPITQQLHAARAAMQQARAMDVRALEPDELAEAERVLAVAEAQQDGSRSEAHFAYVAERRVRRAMADARRDRIEQALARDTRDLEEAEAGVATLDAEVLFEDDGAELGTEGRDALEPIVDELRGRGQVAVIAGFTDSRGTTEHNRELSQRRADAVLAFLAAEGVPRASMITDARGDAAPVAPNDTEEGRSLNRRVEISIYPTATGSLHPARAQTAVASY